MRRRQSTSPFRTACSNTRNTRGPRSSKAVPCRTSCSPAITAPSMRGVATKPLSALGRSGPICWRNLAMANPAPTPYLNLAATAREALTFYAEVFGCEVALNTFAEFDRTDGPADAIAHGYLMNGPVALFASDVAGDEQPFKAQGLLFSLLGTASPQVLRQWFARLAEGGRVVDDLQKRPWGASDGQVIDRFGLHWLIGFEGEG